mgnify:CR=1 FL=1
MKKLCYPFQLELELDYSKADEYIVQRMATEAMEDEHFTHWDHAYESLREWFEAELSRTRI